MVRIAFSLRDPACGVYLPAGLSSRMLFLSHMKRESQYCEPCNFAASAHFCGFTACNTAGCRSRSEWRTVSHQAEKSCGHPHANCSQDDIAGSRIRWKQRAVTGGRSSIASCRVICSGPHAGSTRASCHQTNLLAATSTGNVCRTWLDWKGF